MSLAIALILQAATPALAPAFDLRTIEPAKCDGATQEIVVCGRRNNEKYRLRALPDSGFEPGRMRAETRLFGDVKASVDTENVQFPGGTESKRLMLRLKLPF